MFIKDPNTRKWIYGIVAAAIPVLVILGFVGGEDTQVWLNLAAAVLGLGTAGLAAPNTAPVRAESTPKQEAPVPEFRIDGDVVNAQETAARLAAQLSRDGDEPKHRA
ncbi:hypothetical protein NNX28_17070 [Arthrobacter sp. zg-Y859]|uniref:Holin n=1 Tax=Arthrobacter jinronghuae TaxID=2964609 RepID=A0ABT1NVI9_9MICC|nr:hypothetical protein [Arthrobacter jinronghuae]MCQ1951632.1 hypothetical protein [Arthrobacter jinronghuae]UWX79654.1 hypothetical protein N2K98_05510 [Arthrobacter jinronghuae]